MRDKYSGEVAATLYPYGFYKKFRDAGWSQLQRMEKQQDPGLADGIFITAVGYSSVGAFIEAKTGRERFEFDKWSPRQREFAIACSWSGIPYYIFLMMGTDIRDKKYPRRAYLITADELVEMEYLEQALGRKSLSYLTAEINWTPLTWKGSGKWDIPDKHSFWKVIDGFYHSDTALRQRRHQGSFTQGGYTTRIDSTSEYIRIACDHPLPTEAAELLARFRASGYPDLAFLGQN